MSPLANQIALEFGHRSKQVENQSTLRIRRIDRIVEALQSDVLSSQRANELNQMLQRAPKPIKFPEDYDVTRSHVGDHFFQRRTGCFGATGHIVINTLA